MREVHVLTEAISILFYPVVIIIAVIECDAPGLALVLRAVPAEGR